MIPKVRLPLSRLVRPLSQLPFSLPPLRQYTVERWSGHSAVLGEGALWHSGHLLWVDIKGDSPSPSFHLFDPDSGDNIVYYLPSRVGTVVPIDGRVEVLLALEEGLAVLNPSTRVLTPALSLRQPQETTRLNDGKCDPEGRLWVGSMFGGAWADGVGTQYMIDGSFNVTSKMQGLTIPNGLAWKGHTFYHIDTPTLCIDAYSYSGGLGEITDKRCLYQLPADMSYGYPDGLTLDSTGNIWLACFNGSRVLCINPRTGLLVREVLLPTYQVTSVAFGGPDLAHLFVTSAREDVPAHLRATDKFKFGGQLFRVSGLGVRGVQSQPFVPAAGVLDRILAQGSFHSTVVPSTNLVLERVEC